MCKSDDPAIKAGEQIGLVGAQGPNFVSPCFCVRTISNKDTEETINMKMEVKTVTVKAKLDGSKEKSKDAKTSSAMDIEVPIMVNKLDVEKGEELLIFQVTDEIAPKPAAAKRTMQLAHAGESKKRKGS